MSMDHTPMEAVMVAAFGFDRPEGVGAGYDAANDGVSGFLRVRGVSEDSKAANSAFLGVSDAAS